MTHPNLLPPDPHRLLAKSPAQGGTTLVQHTWEVLARLADFIRLRPTGADIVQAPRLWHCLYWACFLHDFGKAVPAFQRMLHGQAHYPHRHEVVSLAFIDWIAAELPEAEQLWIAAAIAGHHRDAHQIQQMYADDEAIGDALAGLDAATCDWLHQWLAQCGGAWIDALGLGGVGVQPLPLSGAAEAHHLPQQAAPRIRARLRQYAGYLRRLDDLPPAARVPPILLRGITITADHMASAGVAPIPSPLPMPWQQLAARLSGLDAVYTHQRASAAAHGQSVLLAAPTGSGKTEAALYWALGDGTAPPARLFYALPYQASMHAMVDRLQSPSYGFGEAAIGLQHGRAVQALYARLLDAAATPATAAQQAARQNNMTRLHARPIKVFSPYQMLKAVFRVRGFEAMLSDYMQAAFVFDEVHAYDPQRLALFVALIGYLREMFAARFFVMSATFPRLIRERLGAALGAYQEITADAALYRAFCRHRLHLLAEEELLPDGVPRIVADWRAGKQVLVCANTVRRAQAVYAALLAAGVPAAQLFLLHSRFTVRDRSIREHALLERCRLQQPTAAREPLVVVATQVIEVSLNIDLDVLYSEPAPLEALLQRFGRVNRNRRMEVAPVYVFLLPTDGQGVYGRHADEGLRGHVVRVTLDELARHNGQVIDEAATGAWLDRIYADPLLAAQWQEAFEQMYQQAQQLLRGLRPFDGDETTEAQFEKLFDGIDVLPACFEGEYVRLLADEQYLEASRLLVSISMRKYAELKRKGLIRVAEGGSGRHVGMVQTDYDVQRGLLFEPDGRDPDGD